MTDRDRPIDAQIDSPGREGLTGTTPASVYTPLEEGDQITIAPDWQPMDTQPAWRTDFPIDLPQDAYVERRDFMKFLVLTSVAFTMGQLWIGVQNWWRRRRGYADITRITSLADLQPGSVITFTYPGPEDDCVLIRSREGELLAYSQRCTHLSCAVQPQVDEGVIRCPCHNGNFDLRTGRPISGPPRRPLPLVRLEVQNNLVYATGVEERTT
jgi:nitrite reductase/ring-hydroxylating ferredoxin subunit